MPLEQNHLREAVLSALGAAEVPADIAFVNGRVKVSQRAVQNVATLGLG